MGVRLELAQQRRVSPDLNHSEVPNKRKEQGRDSKGDPRDSGPGNRNPAPPGMVTGGNGCPGALQLPEGTERISQGWNKSGIFPAGISSRAGVTEPNLPPTHPQLTPWPRRKPSPGTRPWRHKAGRGKQDRGGGESQEFIHTETFTIKKGGETKIIIIYVGTRRHRLVQASVSRENFPVSIATHHQALALMGGKLRKRS